MSRTRLQMANEVLDNLGRSGSALTRSGTALSDQAVVWLNRAQTWFARKYDLLYNESTAYTVVGTQSYAFPNNVRSVYSLRLEDGLESVKLVCVMPRDIDRIIPKPDEHTTGRPNWYVPYRNSNTFELFRIPDAVYVLRLRHSLWPTDLASDSSTSDYHSFTIDIDDFLITMATGYGYQYLQELIDARDWRARATELAKDIWLSELDSIPDWSPAGKGFSATGPSAPGEYYNNPFVIADDSSFGIGGGNYIWP